MDFSNVTNPWKDWKIVRRIGRGAFGCVYEIEREKYGFKEKAALKVISVPSDESELDSMRSANYDVEQWCRTVISDIFKEYALMSQLKTCPNVVRCDDCEEIPHATDEGSDVCIRMELLKPLSKMQRAFTEEDVIRLGKDISSALVMCDEKGVIHRDIKPDNILMSDDGIYKLGDFGVAREMDHTTAASLKGTPTFMAPEVEGRREYGKDADIYSLGLVLYWLLNNRRHPFEPVEGTPTSIEVFEANTRRLRGEPLPDPVNGSRELKDIVLKACAYNREDRYRNAGELLDALDGLSGEYSPVEMTAAAEIEENKAENIRSDEHIAAEETSGMFGWSGVTEETVAEEVPAMTPGAGMDETMTMASGDELSEAVDKAAGNLTIRESDEPQVKGRMVKRRPKWLIPIAAAVLLAVVGLLTLVLKGPAVTVTTVDKGKLTVATIENESANKILEEAAGRLGLKLITVESEEPDIEELKNGKIDAVFIDRPGFAYDEVRSFADYTDSLYGSSRKTDACLYVSAQNKELRNELNRAILEMKRDGSIKELLDGVTAENEEGEYTLFYLDGGLRVLGDMGTDYHDSLTYENSLAIPESVLERTGFTFAGWSPYSHKYQGYRSDWTYYNEGDTVSGVPVLTAVWKVDPEEFETDSLLREQVEIEETRPMSGVHIIHNLHDDSVDVVAVQHFYDKDGNETRTVEGMATAVPSPTYEPGFNIIDEEKDSYEMTDGQKEYGVIYTDTPSEELGEVETKTDYYVRESPLSAPDGDGVRIVKTVNGNGEDDICVLDADSYVDPYLSITYTGDNSDDRSFLIKLNDETSGEECMLSGYLSEEDWNSIKDDLYDMRMMFLFEPDVSNYEAYRY